MTCPLTFAEQDAMAAQLLCSEGRHWIRAQAKTKRKYRRIVVALWNLALGDEASARDVMRAVGHA